MSDEDRLNPGHQQTRALLRIVGPVLMGIGAIFMVIGFVSFFAAFGTFEPPRYFWCAFIGIPLLGLGGMITKFAFMGHFFRYVAGESAPVAKDTFNYMAGGTREGVRSVAAAVGEGLRANSKSTCGKCGQDNDPDAKYCRNCGSKLSTSCPACGHTNEANARFCDTCGKPIA